MTTRDVKLASLIEKLCRQKTTKPFHRRGMPSNCPGRNLHFMGRCWDVHKHLGNADNNDGDVTQHSAGVEPVRCLSLLYYLRITQTQEAQGTPSDFYCLPEDNSLWSISCFLKTFHNMENQLPWISLGRTMYSIGTPHPETCSLWVSGTLKAGPLAKGQRIILSE